MHHNYFYFMNLNAGLKLQKHVEKCMALEDGALKERTRLGDCVPIF